ncbi:probable C-mannosyltransferase DPY19L4 isoform X2 [Protopterus annectens]|nr:probable C-mannosyltransferase DPY19L4 isoform X2 [Protopterus annectens]
MTEVRQRKEQTSIESKEPAPEKEKTGSSERSKKDRKYASVQRFIKLFIGSLAAVISGLMYAIYLSTYHERRFWFSSRQDLEREITFQSDSGFYYHYYKKLLKASSFSRGLHELTHDNSSISLRTINAVQQLNLYPELVASILYRMSGSQEAVEPVYFYIGVVFGLQAVYVTAVFVCSWIMSGTWVAGMLAVVWYIINRPDTTRADYAVPLRENWALPYFAWQVTALTGLLKNNITSSAERLCYLLLSASTFTFVMMWEHSHYVLFVQAVALFLLDTFDLVQSRKIADVYRLYLCCISLGYILQFQNFSLLTSPLLSLVAGTVLARHIQRDMKSGRFVARVMKVVLHFYLVFVITATLHFVVKTVFLHEENKHVLHFLEVKFGLNTKKNLTTSLLLCHGFLQTPSQDFFLRLTQTSLLPFYVLIFGTCLLSTLQAIFRRLRGLNSKEKITSSQEDRTIGENPEVIYHVLHTVLFGLLTMMFEGLKYIWTPYVCILTASGVCSAELWATLFKWFRLRSVHPVLLALMLSTAVPTIIGFSLWREFLPRVITELSELQEFYDSDTVALMNWIKKQTPVAAVFAGSPQLMSLVKLCTGSTVTSLPLYNDGDLIKRNENLYQIYAMRSAEDIYKMLLTYRASYVIVEEAICSEMGPMRGCRVKDLVDIANGHMVHDSDEIYAYSKYRRFCHEIKLDNSPYVNYFTRVFWNRSYHVYQVNTVISFQY